jgi:hypothetical protein
VSEVEILNFLKKSLGIIIKRLEESGVVSLPSFLDHSFIPELTVDDVGVQLNLSGMVYKLKVIGDYPVYLNIDRPITSSEHTVIFPGSYKIIPRSASTIYLKAPSGFTTKVSIEVLR